VNVTTCTEKGQREEFQYSNSSCC